MLFEHVFYLKIRTCLHDVAWQNVVARNEHFVYAFVNVDVVSGSDVFDVRFRKPTPFCTTRLVYNVFGAT